eukprot:TRINITY_DN17125_c0_g1_i1.p1 TRINITY_DN17125_c0_g1~~TRINITY_DN17125_c0_g1_i1.p1  ORF type:complete len:115 (-),score=10.71 TRINITY_DN17125_c0_g1_i1:1467-1811(-)
MRGKRLMYIEIKGDAEQRRTYIAEVEESSRSGMVSDKRAHLLNSNCCLEAQHIANPNEVGPTATCAAFGCHDGPFRLPLLIGGGQPPISPEQSGHSTLPLLTRCFHATVQISTS